ncbi:MAG: sigma-70 family RNA polymerase sigma factor [Lewinellaceae bacterium]|nr:sigma-70 family RNA polymerase sigma factor [Lewinellaceae bacterium]
MLKEDEGYRKGAIQFVAEDESLLQRLTGKIANSGGKEEDGENFYQQGFVKLHEQLKKGKYNGGAIRGYFFSICYHLWLNSLKKHKPEPYEQVPEPEPDEQDDPFRQFEIKEFKMEFYKAFLKLNERCRNIITLKLFIRESFSMDEIAKMLGFKDGKAVAGALFKCRKKWKELL